MLTPFQERSRRALEDSSFFGKLSHERFLRVFRTSVHRGEILFEKDTPSDRLYGLVGGKIKLYSDGANRRQLTLELVAPGELVGALGIMDGAPQFATAVALAHCELATLQRRDLDPMIERDGALRTALACAGAEAARRLTRRLEDAAFLSIEERIEKTLVDLAHRFGERVERGIRIGLRQQDVADILGLSRESVSKVLTSPIMRGRLALGRGNIVVLWI